MFSMLVFKAFIVCGFQIVEKNLGLARMYQTVRKIKKSYKCMPKVETITNLKQAELI